jgi:hypothetical protein
MVFNITSDVHVNRDKKNGKIRSLNHLQKPYGKIGKNLDIAARSHPTTQALANDYVREVAPLYDIKPEMLTDLSKHHMTTSSLTADQITGQEKLQIAEEKSVMSTTIVSYKQTINDLPIWNAGFSVVINEGSGVTTSSSSIHHDVKLKPPDPNAKFMPSKVTPDILTELLSLKDKKPVINGTKLIVYQYDPDFRIDPQSENENGNDTSKRDKSFSMIPTLPLPAVPPEIEPRMHYVVTEVLFTLTDSRKETNWRALIEVQSGSVLYLRAFVADATGMIYEVDPCTSTGSESITPYSSPGTLDPLRSTVTLAGLDDLQSFRGEFVYISDINPPDIEELPTGNFSYSVPTDNFAAVNAYHHCDAAFRMVQEMGFDVKNYFDGTIFPVPVDHRSDFGDEENCPLGNCVNARSDGNRTGTGSGGFQFALAAPDCKVGIAVDRRVVLHEFGHALLWDSVHWPNFGFAHSAGDGLAAILSDPESKAPDRFQTFPWIPAIAQDRRHDRKVSEGWAWGGSKYAPFRRGGPDPKGYLAEQILSTTMFRIYRVLGGDSDNISVKRLASRYVVYLIIRAIGTLASDPITTTDTPDIFANALMNADIGTANFEGFPGGLSHKVIRWSFEKQGLYQPLDSSTPVTVEGAPPDVDIFIDDGRIGEYSFPESFQNAHGVWNRTSIDAGTTHQQPKYGTENYVYVRVKNRGTHPASNVVVKGYHSKSPNSSIYPDDWQPMATNQISVSESIGAGGEAIVGPFKWIPGGPGDGNVLMIANAQGDNLAGSVPNSLLVPLDNNLAQRNIA